MTGPPDAEAPGPAAAPVLSDSVVGGDNIQIGSARDVTIHARPPRGRRPLVRWLAAGAVLAVLAVVTIRWVAQMDAVRDLSGPLPLVGSATTRLGVGDFLAMADQLSPDEHAGLLREPSLPDLTRIEARHRAARVESMNVLLTLEGRRDAGITIIDVRPRIIRSAPPPSGTCVSVPAQGERDEYELKANLDLQRPEGGGWRFLPKSIDLAYGERATITFTATAARRWHEWDIEVIYSYEAGSPPRSAFFRNPDGQPFRLTGEAKAYSTAWGDPSGIAVGFRIMGRDQPCFKEP